MTILQISRMFQVYSIHYVLLSTDAADSIVRAFNRSCAGQVVAFNTSKTLQIRHTSPLHKFRSCGILYWVFGLILSYFSNRQLQVVLVGRSSQEYGVNVGVPQGYIFGCTYFLSWISGLYRCLIFDIAIYAGDNTLLRIWPSRQWSKWLVNFSAGKTYLASFNCSINPGDINAKMKRMSLMTFIS